MAEIAQVIGAPVPVPRVVSVTRPAASLPLLDHFRTGPGHASTWLNDVIDLTHVLPHPTPQARQDIARLAILFDLFEAHDIQLLGSSRVPYRVFSADHGNFFPNGCGWTAAKLDASNPVDLYGDATLGTDYRLSERERKDAAAGLRRLTPSLVAWAIATAPKQWGQTLDESIAVATFIMRRRRRLLYNLGYNPDLELET